jgi:type IV secretion system protein VirB4
MGFFINFRDVMSYRPFRERKNQLRFYCPWSFFCGRPDEGIVSLKTGALMRTYSYICPDLGSASVESIQSVAYFFNEAIKGLGSDWCVHFESQRFLSAEYPGSHWSNIAGYLIDRRRQDKFTGRDDHFVNSYYLTLTCKLQSDIYAKTKNFLYRKNPQENEDYYQRDMVRKEIDNFRNQTESIIAHLTNRIFIRPLDDNETASYLHASVSTLFHPIDAMKRPAFIDSFITDVDLDIASTLKLGDYYIPVVTIFDFPNETYPAMLNVLNASAIEYRWVIRWLARSKQESSKDIEKYQKRFYGSRKSWGTALLETVGNIESTREDPAAVAFETDTNTAKVELATDAYSFGYFTACIMVWDKDHDVAMDKARYITGIVNSSGFTARIDSSNAFQAFLSMQPGNHYANVRRPVLSSGNLSHIIPLSSVWPGMPVNAWTGECFQCASPLLVCSTASRTAFFLNLNVGDVGHAFIFGPAGSGKSTFLCLLESQFLKYRNANVIILDKDKSARTITMAAGGVYEEPGSANVAFQPLRDLELETDLSWAAEFIKLLLEMQHIHTDARMSEAVMAALRQIRAEKAPERRTISTFQQYVNYTNPQTGQNDISAGVQPYTINGQYGRIFDADTTSLSLAKWVMIEMGTLMKLGPKAVTPALMFLFHFIEKIYTKPSGDPTGDPTLLVLDEAWVFLDNDYFSKTIEEWLVTLRKKRVFCVFATQEVAKAVQSKISTTIVSQCQTKIYLADPSAANAVIANYYQDFGLEPNEIQAISHGVMKKDYFYKSPLGARMFELNLDRFQLALLSPNHTLLDSLEKEYGRNSRKPLATEILKRTGIHDYQEYLV